MSMKINPTFGMSIKYRGDESDKPAPTEKNATTVQFTEKPWYSKKPSYVNLELTEKHQPIADAWERTETALNDLKKSIDGAFTSMSGVNRAKYLSREISKRQRQLSAEVRSFLMYIRKDDY